MCVVSTAYLFVRTFLRNAIVSSCIAEVSSFTLLVPVVYFLQALYQTEYCP